MTRQTAQFPTGVCMVEIATRKSSPVQKLLIMSNHSYAARSKCIEGSNIHLRCVFCIGNYHESSMNYLEMSVVLQLRVDYPIRTLKSLVHDMRNLVIAMIGVIFSPLRY